MKRADLPAIELLSDDVIDREINSLQPAVRHRAYEISCHRGPRSPATDDWLDAERTLIYVPPTQMVREAGEYVLRVLVAGYLSDRVRVIRSAGRVAIVADRTGEPVRLERQVCLDDLGTRRLQRTVAIPLDVDPDSIQAECEGEWIVLRMAIRADLLPIAADEEKRPSEKRTAERVEATKESRLSEDPSVGGEASAEAKPASSLPAEPPAVVEPPVADVKPKIVVPPPPRIISEEGDVTKPIRARSIPPRNAAAPQVARSRWNRWLTHLRSRRSR